MVHQKRALILDSVGRGAVLTALETNEYHRTTKLLGTSVENWISICDILEEDANNDLIILYWAKLQNTHYLELAYLHIMTF